MAVAIHRALGPPTRPLPTIAFVMVPRPGPAKVRSIPLVRTRERRLVSLTEGVLRDWLERADVVSEGQEQRTDDGGTYYGTTSILLAFDSAPDAVLDDLATLGVIAADPHLRLRVLRVARREAEARADGELETLRAELVVHRTTRGLTITVEVEARTRRHLLALHP